MKRLSLLHIYTLLGLLFTLAACDIATAPPPNRGEPTAIGSAPNPPAPTALPSATELFDRAERAIAIGDDAVAGDTLSILLQQYPNSPPAPAAALALARIYAANERWSSAAALLEPLAAGPSDSSHTAAALFFLARAHEAAGAHQAAIEAYERYRSLNTALEPYAALRMAAQLQALGRNDEALAEYRAAAAAPIAPIARANALERAAALARQAGAGSQAVEDLAAILAFAQDPDYRARILGDAISLAEQNGDAARARSWRLELVTAHPGTPQAVAAVEYLSSVGDPELSAATAGRILFTAERWSAAAPWLANAAAAATDQEEAIDLSRLWGLALRAQGDFAGALGVLAEAAARNPNSPAGRLAQLTWVQTIGQSGDSARAVQGYREFAAAYPDDALAPEALDRAAQLLEWQGDNAGAAEQRAALGRAYPQSEQGRRALDQLGRAQLLSGNLAAAGDTYGFLADTVSGSDQARAAYWAARAAADQGDQAAAETRYAQAQSAAPTSYYGVRAAELLGGNRNQGLRPLDQPLGDAEWAALDTWAAGLSDADPQTTPADPSAAFAERAVLLRAVGLSGESDNEWRAGISVADTARAQLQLARAALNAGEYTFSLRIAEQLLANAPADNPPPPELDLLRFPTPYPALVRAEAAANQLDPRLFYALMRQESLFDPDATSWVGARGLAQIMPETGQGIAQNLGVAAFDLADLYQPAVSVRFGTFYLGRRISDMQGSIHGALAAYNGGLGNAQRWAGGSAVADPDLFVEVIDYPETKGYVQAVYRFYDAYRQIYVAP